MLISCFFKNIIFICILRIGLEISRLIQIFFTHKDNKFSRLLAVILDMKIH